MFTSFRAHFSQKQEHDYACKLRAKHLCTLYWLKTISLARNSTSKCWGANNMGMLKIGTSVLSLGFAFPSNKNEEKINVILYVCSCKTVFMDVPFLLVSRKTIPCTSRRLIKNWASSRASLRLKPCVFIASGRGHFRDNPWVWVLFWVGPWPNNVIISVDKKLNMARVYCGDLGKFG